MRDVASSDRRTFVLVLAAARRRPRRWIRRALHRPAAGLARVGGRDEAGDHRGRSRGGVRVQAAAVRTRQRDAGAVGGGADVRRAAEADEGDAREG